MTTPQMVRLRDLGQWSGGNTPAKANPAYWTNGTIPWVSPKDMKVDEISASEDRITQEALDEGRVSMVPEGSILFVTRSGILAHTFPVAVTRVPVTVNQDLKALSPKPGVLPRYVAHAVRGASQRILKSCAKHGTTVASIDTNALLDFEIPMIDLEGQRAAVAEIEKQFSRLDEAVANLQRVKANLCRYRTSVVRSACAGSLVDQEATRERLGRRSYESGAALLARTAHSKPASLAREHLPEGWQWACVADIARIASGNTPAGVLEAVAPTGDVPWFKVGDMNTEGNEVTMTVANSWLRESDVARLSMRLFPAGTVLFPKRGGAIATNKKRILGRLACADLNVMGLTPHPELSDYFFVWFGGVDLGRLSDGSNIPQINNKDIAPLVVPVPPLAEQRRIVAEVDRRLSIVRGVETEVDANLKRARALRQAILAKAFAG